MTRQCLACECDEHTNLQIWKVEPTMKRSAEWHLIPKIPIYISRRRMSDTLVPEGRHRLTEVRRGQPSVSAGSLCVRERACSIPVILVFLFLSPELKLKSFFNVNINLKQKRDLIFFYRKNETNIQSSFSAIGSGTELFICNVFKMS